ncbi:hypothetical protein O0I10_003555 [Lichtheimia ornata]|uniref:Arrestin-like N-terminal domain-containing protein n=1 Tax=Lichtheimia ornata TaxID=688661 RepID=A0AAD7V7M9_9FUNG|nr:uncharacterized protein O0I10_003555 [Lichtheimia ornata]KAJ8660509.1 hypothetical protein O0I10_003555 [Lichtheimia ornata]
MTTFAKIPKDTNDVTIELRIDPLFTGVVHGHSHDVSEGCTLKGICVLHVHRPIHTRKLVISLEGRCKINVRSTTSMATPSPEGIECRSLINKIKNVDCEYFDHGEYAYPFEFELPATLPASFRGKNGYIRYRLEAVLHRRRRSSVMHRLVRVSRDICIRRCLLSDAMQHSVYDTIHGHEHSDKLSYSANAPTMVYREGGLVPLTLTIELTHPGTQIVRSVTCALRERILYQTTGQQSLTCQSVSKTDDLFPLGWSTFYPSENPKYNPNHKHEYNAVFRICPRVNADINTRLIRVTHALVVNIMVQQDNNEHLPSTAPPSPHQLDSDTLSASAQPLPSPPSTPQNHGLIRSSSSSSLRSLSEDLVKEAASALSSITRRNSHSSLSHDQQSKKMYSCTLECPLIVTCREHYWEGERPHPPAYQDTEAPPSYGLAVEQLPPVPCYD